MTSNPDFPELKTEGSVGLYQNFPAGGGIVGENYNLDDYKIMNRLYHCLLHPVPSTSLSVDPVMTKG